jgi:cytochrome b561
LLLSPARGGEEGSRDRKPREGFVMPFKNSASHYGAVSRFLHWSVFLLFVCQYVGANIMTNLARDKTLFGLTQGDYYNWHKSIGLVLLVG